MITCRGLNMAKHLIVELEAVLLEKGKSSKDLVRATGHTTVNVSRIRQAKMRGIRMDTLMEICLELDCQPGDILKIVTDEEFDRLVEERRKTGEARVKAGLRRTAPERVYEIDWISGRVRVPFAGSAGFLSSNDKNTDTIPGCHS